MKRVFLKEELAGKYSLRGFGEAAAGKDGLQPFRLVIESKKRDLLLEFPEACVYDLFSSFNFADPAFTENRFHFENLVHVTLEERECVIEAASGTLYDFFKERAGSGNCVLNATRPIAFYWRGNTDREVA